MAFVNVGGNGFLYPGWSTYLPATPVTGIPAFNNGLVVDAAGEMAAFIGHVWFAGGPGTSKTVSSAGGAIQFKLGTITWATAGTTLRVGLQDVSATAGPPSVPDETWTSEPQKDLVQGTDALSSDTWTTATLTSGSRTITHGDLIAVVFDMTVRNGADSIIVQGLNVPALQHRPLSSHKTGGTWNITNTVLPNVIITCDDGTLASLDGSIPVSTITLRTFNSGSTPDEYGNIITIPFDCKIDELSAVVDPDNEFDLTFYSTALGTPVQEQRYTVDPNQVASTSGRPINVMIGTETLAAGSSYAVTIRPTTVSNVSAYELAVASAGHLAFWPGGTNVYKCSRSNDTGSFTTDTTSRLLCGMKVYQIDDGAGNYTDPGAANVKTGVSYTYDGATQNGTYDGSDRWTDPGEANVRTGVAYKANSTTNNKTGTYTATGGGSYTFVS